MYATLNDLIQALPEDLLIQLTDDEGSGAVDLARINEALITAGAEIDGWCGNRYQTPFADPVPALIRKCAIDVAIYNLYARRLETAPEIRSTRYREAMRLLEKIAGGQVELSTSAAEVAEDPTSSATTTAASRLFTRQSMKGF
jgi:phage gp36-like protein